jgi:amino acid adenylation domain-containing protein
MKNTSNIVTSYSAPNNSDRFMQGQSEGPEAAQNGRSQVPEHERRQLLEEWNATSIASPRNVCVHELFEAQVARTPDRTAVRFGEETLSYRELNEQANKLARHLRSLGVAPGSLVGLCVNRGVRMLAGLFAILKAGGAYVPLEADHPRSRLAHQLSGAVALVTDASLFERFTEFRQPVICIDTEDLQWKGNPGSNIESGANSENLVYVIFTSGSTGVPKGVAVRHRNVVNYINFIQSWLELDKHPEGWHFATVSTLSADLGNTSIFPALASGGTVGVISKETAVESARLARYCREHPVDVLKIVPSHLEALLAGSEGAGVLPRKYLIFGGERLSKRLVQQVRDLGTDCEIVNHYGPTETTIGSVVMRITDHLEHEDQRPTVPIGRPIDNTQIYILDSHLQPVPIGVEGELYISGEGVAAGYLNQPELTHERFIDNPFVSNSKMYRTGDLCRYMPDGNVEFLGRADHQIKVRGFRVELGEIEATLARHPSVQQAVVVANTEAQGEKVLAYVVASSPTEDLRAYLKEQLPDYMVPAAIISLPKLPLNANGKVDRQSLLEPEKFQPKSNGHFASRTATETKIAEIWSEVLGNEVIGLRDDFFEIGGHSLAGIQVMSRVLNHFHVKLDVGTLFDFPTIEGLAREVEKAVESGANETSLEEIRPVPREQYLWR